MSELIDATEENLFGSGNIGSITALDPGSGPLARLSEEVNKPIEEYIKDATGLTELEETSNRLAQEQSEQRKEFQRLLDEAQDAPTDASKEAALARRRRRAGLTRSGTRVGSRKGLTTPGTTGRTTLGG